MIQTQEIITFRVLKIYKWIWRDVYECQNSFLRNDKWQIKFLTLEQQNKGPVMSRGVEPCHAYDVIMISHDIIGVIEGMG